MAFLINLVRVVYAPLVEPLQAAFSVGPGTIGLIVTLVWTGSALPSGTLEVLTYNVAGLPQFVRFVEQANRVPSGSLAGAWGIAAMQVAEAAAPGIARRIALAGAAGEAREKAR